jgi:2-oxoglutarate dehydrogenase E2 component (dihydrolipoamide succinyltransferase)
MSTLRKRVSENLVASKQNSAHLTTFNEVDMSAVKELRAKYREAFEKKYGVRLGFMSFFVKAAVAALQEFPEVNAFVDGREIVYNDYYNIGVAVSTERGLIVPVLRNADSKSFGEIETEIVSFGTRAQEKKLSPDELTGGTFTISNGGVFGSMLSTPIPNPPQTGVLGMHSIDERPVVVDGQIVARPMMYLALTYDHRIIDGREAVRFLVKIRELIQDPAQMLLNV